MRKIEVLAPAGSFEALEAAINGGCDAVYVGGTMFGARAFANNFDEEELIRAIDYVHLQGKQLFLTVNTIIKNKEMEEQLFRYLKKPYEAGLDAVIVQDMGVLYFVHKHFKGLPIHCSTQMSLTMSKGVNLLKEYGVTRLVTSRELSLQEIRNIRATTDLEIESFVHGALCYSYSGQCLMSSMLGGRSGNRGRCAQTCRMTYELKKDGKTISDPSKPYLLSPRDICTLDIIGDLVDSGIDSFKIEGRMKRPEYTALVSNTYRKYIDLYQSLGRKGYEEYIQAHRKEYEEDVNHVLEIYNRGNSSTGYYTCHNGKHMMSTERPNHNGIQVGVVEQVKGKQVVIRVEKELYAQDLLEIRHEQGDTYEYTLKDGVKKGGKLISNYKSNLQFYKGDKVYRTKNKALLEATAERFLENNRKVKITGEFVGEINQPMTLTLSLYNQSVTAVGECPQKAMKQAASEENIRKQLGKMNATKFEFEQLVVTLGENLFIPNGWLNELRRQAVEQLEDKICQAYRREVLPEMLAEKKLAEKEQNTGAIDSNKETEIAVLVSNKEQLEVAATMDGVENIYLRTDDYSFKEAVHCVNEVKDSGKNLFLVMPHIFREETYHSFEEDYRQLNKEELEAVVGFVVKSIEEYEFLVSHQLSDKHIILDYNMHTVNQQTKEFWASKNVTHLTTSVELNAKEMRDLGCEGTDVVVYGHIPLMISAQCLVKNNIGCTKVTGVYHLKDRYKKEFIVKNYCKPCYNVIYNADPIHLLQASKELLALHPRNVRLEFTIEEKEEMKQILSAYVDTFVYHKNTELNLPHFTKGHLRRGIE